MGLIQHFDSLLRENADVININDGSVLLCPSKTLTASLHDPAHQDLLQD